MQQSYQDRKQVALKVLEQIGKFAAGRKPAELASQMQEEMDHLRSGQLKVVVCGECKRGKSTLINAFLEEIDLCPPDAPVATNAITIIRYGATERILVHLEDDNGNTTATAISRGQIRDYVTEQGNTRNQRRVRLLEIWLDNPKLKDGLVLIDTPGVGSLNIEHTAVTYGIIPYADAVLFVGSADEPLSEPELKFCGRIAKHTPYLLHILTKRDCVANADQMRRDNMAKLRSILNRDIPCILVSSTLKLEYLQTGGEDDFELSGFAELERAIWELLGQRGEILIGRAVMQAVGAIERLRMPVQTEFDALSASSPEELKAIEKELKENIERLEELKSNPSLWVNELNRRMTVLQVSANAWLAEEFAEVHQALNAYLRIDDYVKNPKKLGDILTVDCNNGFSVVTGRVVPELGRIVANLRSTTKLRQIRGGKATLRGVTDLALSSQIGPRDETGLVGKMSYTGRMCTIHSMGLGTAGGLAGGIIGAIIGTIAAPGVGTVLGAQWGATVAGGIAGLVGGIFGIKRGIADLAERDMAALRQNLGNACREELAKAQRTVTYELNVLLTNARAEIHESLLKEIQADLLSCEESKLALRKKHADVGASLRAAGNDLKILANFESAMTGLVEPPQPPARATA